uniref:Fat storage-inducing transmembrane protein 2 n=1 Tax=Aceria tosichella TaxID=561515 RepID=A0A6G1SP81_9ACAR
MDRIRSGLDSRKIRQTFTQNVRIPVYCCLILVCSLIALPEDYKIDKRNILNQWFVKLGWFWTTALMLPLMFANIRIDDRLSVSKAVFRFILSTILWYFSTNFFQLIDDLIAFDISGHTFILVYSNLLIASELRLSDEQKSGDSMQHVRLTSLLLTALWDFMLIQTALYYHTVLQKTIAAFWAIGSWYLLHVLFYEDALEENQKEKRLRGRGDLLTTEH